MQNRFDHTKHTGGVQKVLPTARENLVNPKTLQAFKRQLAITQKELKNKSSLSDNEKALKASLNKFFNAMDQQQNPFAQNLKGTFSSTQAAVEAEEKNLNTSPKGMVDSDWKKLIQANPDNQALLELYETYVNAGKFKRFAPTQPNLRTPQKKAKNLNNVVTVESPLSADPSAPQDSIQLLNNPTIAPAEDSDDEQLLVPEQVSDEDWKNLASHLVNLNHDPQSSEELKQALANFAAAVDQGQDDAAADIKKAISNGNLTSYIQNKNNLVHPKKLPDFTQLCNTITANKPDSQLKEVLAAYNAPSKKPLRRTYGAMDGNNAPASEQHSYQQLAFFDYPRAPSDTNEYHIVWPKSEPLSWKKCFGLAFLCGMFAGGIAGGGSAAVLSLGGEGIATPSANAKISTAAGVVTALVTFLITLFLFHRLCKTKSEPRIISAESNARPVFPGEGRETAPLNKQQPVTSPTEDDSSNHRTGEELSDEEISIEVNDEEEAPPPAKSRRCTIS